MATRKRKVIDTSDEGCTCFETGGIVAEAEEAWEVAIDKVDNRGPYEDVFFFRTEIEADQFIDEQKK